MSTKLDEIIAFAESNNAKVERLDKNVVQIAYENGTISRYTETKGVITSETMYTSPDGKPFYAETRKDKSKQTKGQRDLIEELQTEGHFLNEDGSKITDREALEKLRDDISSMSDSEVMKKYGKSRSIMNSLLTDASDTLSRSEVDIDLKDIDIDDI